MRDLFLKNWSPTMVTIRHLSPINCNCKFSFFYLVCFVCLVRCYNERYWAKNTQECDWTLVLGCLYCAGVAVLEQYLMNSLRLGQEMLPVHWHTDIWVTSCSSCFPFNLKHVCCCPHSAQGDSYFISQKAWRFQTLFCESLIRKSELQSDSIRKPWALSLGTPTFPSSHTV